jgi:hypothetical protein
MYSGDDVCSAVAAALVTALTKQTAKSYTEPHLWWHVMHPVHASCIHIDAWIQNMHVKPGLWSLLPSCSATMHVAHNEHSGSCCYAHKAAWSGSVALPLDQTRVAYPTASQCIKHVASKSEESRLWPHWSRSSVSNEVRWHPDSVSGPTPYDIALTHWCMVSIEWWHVLHAT